MGTVRAGRERVLGHPVLPNSASARTKGQGWMFTNYVPLRRGLEEHAKFGRGFGLTHEQGWAFTLILMRADCETGLWRGSSKALLQYNWTHRQLSEDRIPKRFQKQKAKAKPERCSFFSSYSHSLFLLLERGHSTGLPVAILPTPYKPYFQVKCFVLRQLLAPCVAPW